MHTARGGQLELQRVSRVVSVLERRQDRGVRNDLILLFRAKHARPRRRGDHKDAAARLRGRHHCSSRSARDDRPLRRGSLRGPLFRANIGAASCAAIRGGRSGCAKPIAPASPTAPCTRGGAASRERAAPVAAASMGRLTTIRQGAAMRAGLPSGASRGAMAGTPPDRGDGALVTPNRPTGSAGPGKTHGVGTLVAARMAPADCARAGAWQPACAELAITMGLRISMP
eukprot:scaffold2278_cov124-Isochrysis_galbana.AAC.1